MSLPADQIVSITTNIGGGGVGTTNFGLIALFVSDAELKSGETWEVNTYKDLGSSDYAQYFETTTEAYDALSKIFGVNPKPSFVRVWMRDVTVGAETPVESLSAAVEANAWFFPFTFTDEAFATETDYTAIQTWAGANGKLFCGTTNDADVVNPALSTDPVSLMVAAGIRNSFIAYHDVEKYSGICIAALYSGVNYSGVNTATSAFGKVQPYAGLDLGVTAYNTLNAKGAVYSTKVTAGSETTAGKVMNPISCSANNESISEVFDSYAFSNALTVSLLNYMTGATTKVPQTLKGQAGAIAAATSICEQYFTNGYLGPRQYVDSQDGQTKIADHGYVMHTTPEDIYNLDDADRGQHKLYPINVTIYPAGEAWSVQVTVNVEL